MEQLYNLYTYSTESRSYERPVAVVTMSSALKAAKSILNNEDNWRVCHGNAKLLEDTGTKFSEEVPLEIEVSYWEYEDDTEKETTVYSLEAIDMKYL